MIKYYLKTIFNWLGYEIKKCQVSEKKKWDWLRKYKIDNIFDIGANTGEWAIGISREFPQSKIYSFEPIKECYQKLVKITRGNDHIKCYNMALGDQIGQKEIYKNDHISSSSILKMKDIHFMAFPNSRGYQKEIIEVNMLDNIVKDLKISGNIFVKIDVQGFEKHVLVGSKNFIEKVEVFLIEVSFKELYENQPLFNDIYLFMKSHGFNYMGDFESIKSPKDGSILQSNAIFIKM